MPKFSSLPLICAISLRRADESRGAPLTFTDEQRPAPDSPVAPAERSAAAQRKASTRTNGNGEVAHSFDTLLAHLATLTRNDLRYGEDGPVVPTLAEPTPLQREAFRLIGATIPLHLKK